MKKIIRLLMIGVLSTSLITGCGGNANTGDSQQAAQESTQENSQENSEVNTETEVEAVYPTSELMTPAEAFAGGDGSKESPYEISNAEELYRMASIINGYELGADKSYYVLTADIVINDVTNYENWEKKHPSMDGNRLILFKGILTETDTALRDYIVLLAEKILQ